MTTYRYNGYTLGNISPGRGMIWMDNVRCRGNETNIASCPRNRWGIHNCLHHEDVSVRCGPDVTGKCCRYYFYDYYVLRVSREVTRYYRKTAHSLSTFV